MLYYFEKASRSHKLIHGIRIDTVYLDHNTSCGRYITFGWMSSCLKPRRFAVCWYIDICQSRAEIEGQLRSIVKGFVCELASDQTLISSQVTVKCSNGQSCNFGFCKEVTNFGSFLEVCKASNQAQILSAVVEFCVSVRTEKVVAPRQPLYNPRLQRLPRLARGGTRH